MERSRTVAFVVLSLISVVLATCGIQHRPFIGGMPVEITTLDPHKSVATADDIVNPLIWEPLVAMNSNGNWQGILAESWQVSEDGLVWTFHLREEVRFHNGREMTSDDVIYSFDRILDERTGASMYSVLSGKIESIKPVGTHVVRFVLSRGAGTFLSEIGLGVRCAIIAKECVSADGSIVQPIGTGPFKFEFWKPGIKWKAERFDYYWDEVAQIDTLVFVPFPDEMARFKALQTGEVDWVKMVPFNKAVAAHNSDIIIEPVYNPNTFRLNFNCRRPPFDDPKMRRAVAYALDKDEINQAVFFGMGRVHNQPFPRDSFLHLYVEDPYRNRSIDEAKFLMTEAGYSNGCEITVVQLQGWYRGLWELIASQLHPLGIKLNVEIVDSAQGVERLRNGDFDLFVQSQSSIFHWDRTFGYFEEASSSNWLVGGYHNDEVAFLLDRGRNTADLGQAKQIYTRILQSLQDDAATVFILSKPDVHGWRKRVRGFQPNPVNGFLIGPGVGLNHASLEAPRSDR